jgi:hypothetical protein
MSLHVASGVGENWIAARPSLVRPIPTVKFRALGTADRLRYKAALFCWVLGAGCCLCTPAFWPMGQTTHCYA